VRVLVLNCGSSSVKFQLIETSLEQIERDTDRRLCRGSIEKIGAAAALVSLDVPDHEPHSETEEILDHRAAISHVVNLLTSPAHGVIRDRSEIDAVGHRIVHGGEHFSHSVLIDEDVATKIRGCIELAPLHNPSNLRGYSVAKERFPDVPHCAVFDTAFHQTIPPHAYLYGVPRVLHRRHGIRRYGFHGTSHAYCARRLQALTGSPISESRVLTAHLGNGCSITAIDHGKSVETSMGFTPLEGLLMGTRSGDIDPAAILHVMGKEELRLSEATALLNKHSGLLGVSGLSNDMRELIEASDGGDANAALAIRMFCHRLKKYIGAYAAVMGGIDHLVFTGVIGEHAAPVRAQTLEGMEFLGVELDRDQNAATFPGKERRISTAASRAQVWIIPTDEERVIARDTVRCIEGKMPAPQPAVPSAGD
jgi:acetate kinase